MAITPGRMVWPGETGLEPWLEGLLAAGVEALHVREKSLSDGALYELVRHLVERLEGGCRVIVNGRADLAIAAGAQGVHLPADGLPAAPLRERLGSDFLIGRSTHRPEEVAQARDEGCDYVVFGPVLPTPSKAERGGEIPGFAGLEAACGRGLPVLALGGITTADDVEKAARAGAHGIAAIRAFLAPQDAADLVAAVRRLWPASSPAAEPPR